MIPVSPMPWVELRNSTMPINTTIIAAEATILGWALSDTLPATSEKTAMTTGCTSSTRPAFWGLSPSMYWR